MPAGDTDCDGDYDNNDQGAIALWEMLTVYDVRGDVNLDGFVNSADSGAATTEWPDNPGRIFPRKPWI